MVLVRSIFLAVLLLAGSPADAGEWDLSGNISLETRVFPYHPAFADQDRTTVSPSVALQPELVFETESSNDRLTVQPFFRYDRDDPHRTHGDIRIANWLHQAEIWDLVVGLDKVFWGVAESRHLVDIVNQTDLVERADGEEKLGQPMVNLNVQSDFGTWSAFILPGFRERTFPGRRARLRGPLRVDVDNPVYHADLGDKHVDGAVRWSHSLSGFDVGISHFYGTSREPRLVATVLSNGETVLVPLYDLIHQTGLDIQYTKEALLLKLESISNRGTQPSPTAATRRSSSWL